MKCVNKSLPEYKDLKRKTGIPDFGLSLMIMEYQSNFNTDEFPSVGYLVNKPSFNRNEELRRFYDNDSGQEFYIGLSDKDKLGLLKKIKDKYPLLDVRFEKGFNNSHLRLVAYNKQSTETTISREAFFNVVNDLSKRLNIPYELITKEQARQILKGHPYNGESAFFFKGKVYFTELNLDDAIHEFAHPFVRAIAKTNPDLFVNILEQIVKEHPEIYANVERLYPEEFKNGEPSMLAYEEMAVAALTKLGRGNIDTKTGKSVLERLWNAILQVIESLTGISVKNLKPTATLQDLADLLTSYKGTIDVSGNAIKPGVEELFNSNSELSSIGTPAQYSAYLDTIFPNSNMKDIVYHGTTTNEKFDRFKPITKDEFRNEIKNAPVYFSDSIFYAEGFAKNEVAYKNSKNIPNKGIPTVISAVINIAEYNEFNKPQKMKASNFRFATEFNKEFEHTFHTTSPEQIHILGSKQDVDGFKKFVGNQNTSFEQPAFSRTSQPATISLEHSTAIEAQKARLGDDATQAQLSVAYKLANSSIKLQELDAGTAQQRTTYVENGVEFKRAGEYLKGIQGPNEQPDYYVFNEADETKYAEYREWGNQYDDLAKAVIMGYTFDEALLFVSNSHEDRVDEIGDSIEGISIPESELQKVYDSLTNVIENELAGYMLIPQVIFKSDKNKIAGTADIVAISPDGKIKILDVKSSKVAFESIKYREEYRKNGTVGASKFNRYTAQVSLYKGMAQEEGFVFEENNELGIFNILSTSTNNKEVSTAAPEGLFYINGFTYIANKFTDNANVKLTKDELESIKKIKMAIEEQLFILEKNSNVKAGDFKKYQLEQLKVMLSSIEQGKALYAFIDETYKTFIQKEIGEGKVIYGIKYNIRTLASKIQAGTVTDQDALDELYYYKQLVEIYGPIIDDISAIFSDKDSPEMAGKIGNIVEAFNQIRSDYKKSAIPLVAEILFNQVNPELNKTIKEFIAPIKKELEEIKVKYGETSKEYKIKALYLDKQLTKLKSEEGLTKEVIMRTLQEGSLEDISTIDMWTSPAISSNNELMSLLAKHFKERSENARQESIDLEWTAKQAFEDYVGSDNSFDPTGVNRPFYESVSVFTGKYDDTGNPIFEEQAYFISDTDHNAYEKARASALAKAVTMGVDGGSFMKEWYRANTQLRPKKDITITNPYTGETQILEKGLDTLLAEKEDLKERNIITESQLNSFKKSLEGREENGKVYYNSELTIPNKSVFGSNKVDSLSPKQKRYYNFLMSTYIKSQNRAPVTRKNQYKLPSVVKQGAERAGQNGLSDYFKYNVSNAFTVMEEDLDRYGERSSTGVRTIPILYSQRMNASDVSKDLLRSIMLFDSASLVYEARTATLPLAKTLIDLSNMAPPLYRDTLLNKSANAFAKSAGIDNEFLKSSTNNIAKFLEAWTNTHIFGETNFESKTSFLGKTLSLDKLADSVKSFASFTQIGGINPIGAVANSLQANVQLLIEAHGGQYVNKAKLAKGKAVYAKAMVSGDFIKDFNNGAPTSFLGQLAAIYDAMQGEYLDKYGNKVTATNARKLFNTDTWFFGQHQGEHEAALTMMIAFLDSIEVTQKGEKISLLDAYELGTNGRIKLKDGVTLPGKTTANNLISLTAQNRLHAINKRMHGVYNSADRPELKKHFMGRLLFMYKDFIIPGLKKRYKTIGTDNELDDITEGYYTTFFRHLKNDYKKMARQLIGLEKSNLQPWEKANLRKAMMEMGVVCLTGFAVILLKALFEGGDDDDKKYLKHLLFLTMRLNHEMGIYFTLGDPQNKGLPSAGEALKTVKQPFAIMGTIQRLFDLIDQVTNEPTEIYKRDSGVFQKGDSKVMAKLYKLIGITGINWDPEPAIKYQQSMSK